MYSVHHNSDIYNFVSETGVTSLFSKPVISHIQSFMASATAKGFSGKTVDLEGFNSKHRTAFSHFLSKGKWNESWLDNTIKETVIAEISEKSDIVFVSLDDTVACKKKPSSQAIRPMQSTGFHHSNLEGKLVWGHSIQAVMMSCGDISLNYDIHLYDRKGLDKISYAVKVASTLPIAERKSYALTDSWYTCSKVIDAFESRGYYCIGALKTNRIITPLGVRVGIKEYSKYISKRDVRLVTANRSKYYVYRYEGSLSGIGNAVVLITWPIEGFSIPSKMRAFLCTDTTLSTEEILKYYGSRWSIETFFQQQKMNFGLSKYQIRSQKGIERYLLLLSYVHLFCMLGLEGQRLGEKLRSMREQSESRWMKFIYKCGQNNIPFENIKFLYAS